MRRAIYRAADRWDHFLNGDIFVTAVLVFVLALVPAALLGLLAEGLPVVGWLAISLALTVAVMVRRPRG